MLFLNISNGITLILYNIIALEPYQITYYGVLGCTTADWMKPVIKLTFLFYILIPALFALLYSKKGAINGNFYFTLIGAFLFYPAIQHAFTKLFILLTHDPLWFIERKEIFTEMSIPIINNLYHYMWTAFFVDILLLLFVIFSTCLIVVKYWNKRIRIYFIYGACTCILGQLFWFYVLGPILY